MTDTCTQWIMIADREALTQVDKDKLDALGIILIEKTPGAWVDLKPVQLLQIEASDILGKG